MRTCAAAVLILVTSVAACTREQKPPVPSAQEQIQQKFTALYRAARAIDAATTEGVAYAKFTELLSTLSKEMLIARDMAATAQEKAVVSAYEDVFAAWKDSVEFWDRKRLAAETPIFGPLLYWGVGSQLTAKAATYQIEVRQTSKIGIVVTDPEPVQKVWKAADVKSKRAVQLYLGSPGTATTTR